MTLKYEIKKISEVISIVLHEEKSSLIRIINVEDGAYSDGNKGVLVTVNELEKILEVK